MSVDWTDGIAPALAHVECGGERHTLLWENGVLHALDHPDPEAERALAALGGDPCACIELLDAWSRHAADPRVLLLGPRGGESRPGTVAGESASQRMGWATMAQASAFPVNRRGRIVRSGQAMVATSAVAMSVSQASDRSGTDSLGQLLALDGPIPRRLVATVAAALMQRAGEPFIAHQLQAALYGRLLAGLGLWLGQLPSLEVEVIDAGAERSLAREPDGTLVAAVPLCWLTEVWAPELVIVAGQFTLAAPRTPTGGWHLVGVNTILSVNRRTLTES